MTSHLDPLHLSANVDSARLAREVARSIALRAGADARRALDAAIITSELVSNAARVATAVDVRFSLDGPVLRIEVDDDGIGQPHLIDGSENGGFGLRLVDELSSRWGCDLGSGAKTVWAEVDQVGSAPSLHPAD